jgi:hypothetical protein
LIPRTSNLEEGSAKQYPANLPASKLELVQVKAQALGLMSGEHFTVDGALIEAWASHQSCQRKDTDQPEREPVATCGLP